jgi:hypothetical protein
MPLNALLKGIGNNLFFKSVLPRDFRSPAIADKAEIRKFFYLIFPR